MKRTGSKLLSAAFLLLAIQYAAYSKSIAPEISFRVFHTQINGVNYSIDPRIELFQTVMLLAGNPLINTIDIDYKTHITKRFAPYQQHPLFGFIKKYGPQGKLFTSIDAPIWYMLHLTPQLEWRKDMANPYAKQPLMDSLRVLMQQFAAKSRYDDFFNGNADFYRISLSNLRFNLGNQDEKKRLLDYYGVKERKNIRFNVIINFLGYGHFGPRLETDKFKEFYAVIAPSGNIDNVPVFNQTDLYGLIWHEFGHSFANPLVEEYMAQFATVSNLWEPIKASMQSQAYWEWKVVLWEHLVNAVMCRLAADKHGEDYARVTYTRTLLGKRWIYLNPLLESLKKYESNRVKYPDLRSFMPEIVNTFKHIQPQDVEQWQQKTLSIRLPDVESLPMLGAVYGKPNVLFILSTGETNRQGDTRLKAFVKAYQATDFPSASVVDDTIALKMNLSEYHLFVVGTPQGNRFLQQVLPQLPIKLTAEEIIVGKKYEGNDYLFMSGWVNPFNTDHVMAIYTAQDPDNLVNFTAIPRGGTNYLLTKGLITIKEGNYSRNNLIWGCR